MRKTLKRMKGNQRGGTLDPGAPVGTEIIHPGSPAVLKGDNLLQKVSAEKLIYIVKERPGLLVKIVKATASEPKPNIQKEIELQMRAYNNVALKPRVPRIYDVFWSNDEDAEIAYILMSRLQGKTLADEFGETAEEVAEGAKSYEVNIWKQVRSIIQELYNMGILYYDITGYNFMYKSGFVTILDFGHAYELSTFSHPKKDKILKYVQEFLAGKNEWFSWE